jgi:hypothetical protein
MNTSFVQRLKSPTDPLLDLSNNLICPLTEDYPSPYQFSYTSIIPAYLFTLCIKHAIMVLAFTVAAVAALAITRMRVIHKLEILLRLVLAWWDEVEAEVDEAVLIVFEELDDEEWNEDWETDDEG